MSKEDSVRFSTLNLDGTETNVRYLRNADIRACPAVILWPEHYRENGTCKCDQKTCEYTEIECPNWKYMGEIFCQEHLETMYGEDYLKSDDDE